MHSCNQYVEAMERPTRRQAMGKIKVGKTEKLAMGLILSTQIHQGMVMSSHLHSLGAYGGKPV